MNYNYSRLIRLPVYSGKFNFLILKIETVKINIPNSVINDILYKILLIL